MNRDLERVLERGRKLFKTPIRKQIKEENKL